MKKLIILGASGSSLDILTIIDAINKIKKTYNFLGFLDDNQKKISNKYKKKILGKLKDIKKFKACHFSIGIGNEKNFYKRKKIISDLNISKNKFPNIIHPSSIICDDLKIGFGNIIHPLVTISRDTKIGDFNNILPKTTINHDVKIGSYNIINSNSIIAGDVTINNNCYIGQGSNIRDHITVENKVLTGMGSVVTKSLKSNKKYAGVPAKMLNK